MKKKFLFLFILPMCLGLVSCSGDGSELTGNQTVSLYEPVTNSYTGDSTASAWATLTLGITKTYGTEVPFMTVDTALGILVKNGNFTSDQVYKQVSGSQITYHVDTNPANLTITVDCAANTVTFSDYASYSSKGSQHYVDVTDSRLSNCFTVTNSSYKNNSAVTFDLNSYEIDILLKDRTPYLPFSTCSYLFLNPWNLYFGWNGQDLYYISGTSCLADSSNHYSSYASQYYSGPLSGTNPSAAAAKLHGNESMFYLDHFYGLKDDTRFEGKKFSEYLKEYHNVYYNLFFSNGQDDSQRAWDYTITTVIGDGHSAVTGGVGSIYTGGKFTKTASRSERMQTISNTLSDLSALRQEKLGMESSSLTLDKMVEISGDLAIIRYDSFQYLGVDSRGTATNYRNLATRDNYSLFAYAFSQIESAGGVSKVVIDLTLNTGGTIAACFETLGFLKDSYSQTFVDTVSGCLSTITMQGVHPYGRTNSYAGEYEFYVMISGGSFSCGTLFPTVCKNNGMATLIGQQSGGGGCVVGYMITPSGQFLQISSTKGLSKDGGTETDDSGITPDHLLDKYYFYDTEMLKDWLSTLK